MEFDWLVYLYLWINLTWGVLLFLIYSVWTTLVLIDKKKENLLILTWKKMTMELWVETVLWVTEAGSQEVFGKHRLGQKCYRLTAWGVWLCFLFFVFIVNSIETPLKLLLFFTQNQGANNLLRRWWNCAEGWKKEKVGAWTELNWTRYWLWYFLISQFD